MPGFWRRLLGSRSAIVGIPILSVVVVVAASAPILFPESPFRRVDRPFQPPFGAHLFGTDVLGRNVAAGIAHGARTSLLIGLLATTVAVMVGTAIGGIAGYYGGGPRRPPVRVHPVLPTNTPLLFPPPPLSDPAPPRLPTLSAGAPGG